MSDPLWVVTRYYPWKDMGFLDVKGARIKIPITATAEMGDGFLCVFADRDAALKAAGGDEQAVARLDLNGG